MEPEAARAWLDGREPAPPAELRARLDDDLDGTDGFPAGFAEAALRRLRQARERSGERAAAFDLLAADAYLTYACEAAVDPGGSVADREGEAPGPEEVLWEALRAVAGPTA